MEVDTEFVERVEARLGMGHGAWDHLKPEDICEAVLVEARVAEMEAEIKSITETVMGYIDQLTEQGAILEAIMGALNGEEPSDFMRSFPDVERAWWVYRVTYPKP